MEREPTEGKEHIKVSGYIGHWNVGAKERDDPITHEHLDLNVVRIEVSLDPWEILRDQAFLNLTMLVHPNKPRSIHFS